MLSRMTSRLLALALISATACHLTSCGDDTDLPIMAGNTQVAAAKGEELYVQAKAADDAGKAAKAIKLYDQTATRYPFATSAAKARFRQAQLLENQGDIAEAFEAYDKFLLRFPGSDLYTTAFNRQVAISQSASNGDLKGSTLGLTTKLPLEKTVAMLGKVRDNAPKSPAAAKSQFTIGKLYEGKKKSKEAIAAYRLLVNDQPGSAEAPEALFRIGLILTAEADRGNQNQANVDLAREAFNDYLIQYPGHSRNGEARQLVANLGSRDLQKSYDIAEFYQRSGKTESAKVYFRDIATRTKSGALHDKAKARLKELGE